MSKKKPDTGEQQNPDQNPGPTRRLEKAIDDIVTEGVEGTLMSIEAHTGEHVAPPAVTDEASVTDELKKVRPGQKPRAGTEPAATMYEPTKAGAVGTGGSNMPTQYGPTGTGAPQPGTNPGGSVSGSASGARPVAPFGGKIVVGTRVGQIEVTGVLGKGGMGEVFKGYHHALDINVAIKVLPDELSRNELVRQRFLREARLCVKLDHQNIVRVFNVDEYAGNLFLVMEMVEGTDAAHMLKNGGRFRYKRALEIGAGGAEALAYAHTQGLVHRDVKPHNILLGAKDGKIKLSDFGLARAAASSSHLTMSGQIMGTPHYMSPEQAEAKEVTDKSDVYSLGVTLYHMLTGETPFVGDTPISVAVQHIAKEILFPEIRFAPFPKELTAVLKRMVAKDPAKRCSAKQAAVWLQKLIAMAPADDIQLAPDAMQTIAPVVRESQAFEQAAQERAQRDNHAREAARTMLATMREAPASQTRSESRPTPSQSAPVIIQQEGGSGAKIAAAVMATLLVVGAGAAAGWYFLLGPGAANNAGTPIASGNSDPAQNRGGSTNTQGTPTDNTAANTAGNTGGSGNSGGNGNNGGNGAGNGGENSNGNQPANNGSTDPIDTNPPQPVDSPIVAGKLLTLGQTIANVKSLSEAQSARNELASTRMEMDKASERQREEFRALEASVNRQFAYYSALDFFDRINESLKQFESVRDTDRTAAVRHLNAALDARAGLLKLSIPPETEALVGTDRDVIVGRVTDAVDAFWGDLIAEADTLVQATTYLEAEKLLAMLETLKVEAERTAALQPMRAELRTRDRHKRVRGHIDNRDFTKAAQTIKEAETEGIPTQLEAEHKAVVEAYVAALDKAYRAKLQAALDAAGKADFAEARSQYEAAKELPLNSEQVTELATLRFFLNLKEKASLADTALDKSDFNLARTHLLAIDELMKEIGDRVIPADLNTRLTDVRTRFDKDLSVRFEGLMAAAQAELDEKDFAGVSDNLKAAAELPLNDEQADRLEKFSESNKSALDEFVRGLLADIAKALDENRFDAAQDGLKRADAMPIPSELETTVKELRDRFNAEAAKRHIELVKSGRDALDARRYADARRDIEAAMRIPVSPELAKKATELDTDYTKTLTADVQGRIADAEELIKEGKYKKARELLQAALELPLDDDLRKLVRRKLDTLAETVEGVFGDLLEKAYDAIKTKMFKSAEEFLKEAEKLDDLTQEQLSRLSTAQDALKKALADHIEGLFKELEDCVSKGKEEEGKRVLAKLDAFVLSITQQTRRNQLAAALTGETDTARIARLPKHLKSMFGNHYLKAEQLINVGERLSCVTVTNDGKFGAAGADSGRVYFYNLKRGITIGNSSGGRRKITSLAFSQDGTRAVSGNDNGEMVMYEIAGTSVQAFVLGSVNDDVMGLCFNLEGTEIYVGSRDGMITRFNARNKSSIGTTKSGIDTINCMALSPDGKWLAAAGDEGQVCLFDAKDMLLKKTLVNNGDENIQSVAFSAKSDMVIAGSIEDKVSMWDVNKPGEKPVKSYKGVDEWIRGVGFTADGKRAVMFDTESRVVIVDARSGTEITRVDYAKLKGEKDFLVEAGVVGPDGTVLIATRAGELLHMYAKPPGR